MTPRNAKRPLTGVATTRVEVLLGRRAEGHPTVSLHPSRVTSSGTITTRDPGLLRGLAADLVAAADYLEAPDDYREEWQP